MRLVEELRGFNANYYIITGDGTREFEILRELCRKYNGHNKILWFPRRGLKKRSGLSALDAVKDIPGDFGIYQIIYTVDAEHIEGNPHDEIKNKLGSIGINSGEVNPLENAFFMRCNFANYNNIILYCIITGETSCIEEEIAKLMELKYGVNFDLSGEKNANWRNKLKNEINRRLREIDRQLTVKTLVRASGRRYLEESFPNICAVLKEIERDC